MSTPLIGTTYSRYSLESHTKDGALAAVLPYRNIQSEMQLNDAGSQLRCNIPFRGFSQVNQNNLMPGKHELWLMDSYYSNTIPLFRGPLWAATASSSTGVVSCSAEDGLSYLAKRVLRTTKNYAAQKLSDIFADLITTTNAVAATGLTSNIVVASAGTVNWKLAAGDVNIIADLLKTASQMGAGVDYYLRNNVLQIYGDKIKPGTPLTLGLEYGGEGAALPNYSLQIIATGLYNVWWEIGANGVVGNAQNAGSQAIYGLQEKVDRSSSSNILAQIQAEAAAAIAGVATPIYVPSLVTKTLRPLVDFDFGSQFTVNIQDEWSQYSGLIRVVGWQITIGGQDDTTVVMYTNNTSEVT